MQDDKYGFSLSEGEELTLETAVFQSLGAASVAWSETPTGVFDGTRAKEVGDNLIAAIREKGLS